MPVNSDYKVSVIVPVYNVEQYLSDCLESICRQTLKGIEIIVVNDGSTDNSLSIIESFQQKYSNMKLINKKNGGLSSARNAGIKVATAPYLCFIDSDDFIDLDAIEKMYKKAITTNAPLVVCNMLLFWSDKITRDYRFWNMDQHKTYSEAELLEMLLTDTIGSQCCNKLYDSQTWKTNSLLFREGRYYEDIDMAFRIIKVYQHAVFINDTLYKYRMRAGSIVAVPSKKKIEDFVLNTVEAITFILENMDYVDNLSVERFKMNSITYAFELLHKLGGNRNIENWIKNKIVLSSTVWDLMLNRNIPIKNKIRFIVNVKFYPLIGKTFF